MANATRRDFLATLIRGSLILAGAPGIVGKGRAQGGKTKEVTSRIIEVQGPPEKALAELLEGLGGITQFVHSGATVLLKPNMSFANAPEMATTTSPRLVKAMIRMCLEAGAKRIIVTDHPMRPSRLCMEKTGMRAVCDGTKGVYLLAADDERMYQRVLLDKGKELREVKVLKALLDADVYINIPKMKAHSATTVSLGTKGNMGLIWDRGSFHVRMDLNQAIADLNTYIRADLTILDGTRVLIAGGPQGPGPVEELDCLIGGTDPVAVDAFGAERVQWYGRSFTCREIPHLVACNQRGVGEIDLDRVDIKRQRVS